MIGKIIQKELPTFELFPFSTSASKKEKKPKSLLRMSHEEEEALICPPMTALLPTAATR